MGNVIFSFLLSSCWLISSNYWFSRSCSRIYALKLGIFRKVFQVWKMTEDRRRRKEGCNNFWTTDLIFSLLFESLVIVFHCVVTLDNSWFNIKINVVTKESFPFFFFLLPNFLGYEELWAGMYSTQFILGRYLKVLKIISASFLKILRVLSTSFTIFCGFFFKCHAQRLALREP